MANTLNCMSGKEVPSSVSISGRTQSGTRDRAGHTKTLASGGTGITDARLTGPFSSGIQAVTAFGHPLARPDSSLLGTGILISVQSIEAVCCLGLPVFWASMDVPFHDASFVCCKLMWLSGTQKPTASFGYLLCCFKSFGESAVQANEQMRPDAKRGMTAGHVKLTGRTNTGHPMYYGTKIMVKQVRRGKAKGIDFRGRIESINCRGIGNTHWPSRPARICTLASEANE